MKLKGSRNKVRKLVCGVGINDADYIYKTWETLGFINGKRKTRVTWICPFYSRWKHMITRCYSERQQKVQPTYLGCSVCEEWLTFSKFKSWMETQDWEGKELNKDLLVKGNRIYSVQTCIFVSKIVNRFLNGNGSQRGKYQLGVSLEGYTGKFKAQCRNPLTNKKEYLGLFESEIKAYEAWLARKQELATLLAGQQMGERVAQALINYYKQ